MQLTPSMKAAGAGPDDFGRVASTFSGSRDCSSIPLTLIMTRKVNYALPLVLSIFPRDCLLLTCRLCRR